MLYRTIIPQMTNWLPEEEGAQLRFEFETELARLWRSGERCYLVLEGPKMQKLAYLLGKTSILVKSAGGKSVITNF